MITVSQSCSYYSHSTALYCFIDFDSGKITLLKSSPIVLVFILGITDEHCHNLVGFSLISLYIMPAYSWISPTREFLLLKCFILEWSLWAKKYEYNLKLREELHISPKPIPIDLGILGVWPWRGSRSRNVVFGAKQV